VATFKELLRVSFKSDDTEEWFDVWFTRPIGLVFALLWNRLGIHPNVITIVSFFFGALVFHEKNRKSKALDLFLVLLGMVFLYLGTR
jgi:multidrug transporter EmrE-like cation transporter